MVDVKTTAWTAAADAKATVRDRKPGDLPMWEAPKLEDGSEQVMAQPYIRFT
jgi:hypothetical protein